MVRKSHSTGDLTSSRIDAEFLEGAVFSVGVNLSSYNRRHD